MEVAHALSFKTGSKERRDMIDRLRKKGNFLHNKEVKTSGTGELKLSRQPKKKYSRKDYVDCMYCKGLYIRRDYWRHEKQCSSKPAEVNKAESGRTRVLALTSMMDSTWQQVSPAVFDLLQAMHDDDISGVARSDFLIMQLAQTMYNRYGQDSTKHGYI